MSANEVGREFDRERQFQSKRERILKVAAGCFNRLSYSGTSLKDIANHLNITDAALYYYVKGKEELVFLCYARALSLVEEALDAAGAQGSTGLEKMTLYIERHIEALCGPQGPIAILSEVSSLTAEHQASIRKRIRAGADRTTQFIADGVADGSIICPDPYLACRAVVGAISWVPHWFDPTVHDAAKVKRSFVGLLTRSLAARPD